MARRRGTEPVFSEIVELDLSTVVPSIAGPSRPQDRVALAGAGAAFRDRARPRPSAGRADLSDGTTAPIADGDVVIAAITSCTNTSNPQVMVAAGLVAKRAVERGLRPKPWVKTSLAPGSRVVMDYLERAGLTEPLGPDRLLPGRLRLHHLHRQLGAAAPGVSPRRSGTTTSSVAAVLSGNRNFEGRIHPDVRMNYLASPPLVVAYALAGTMDIDLTTEPIGDRTRTGRPVYLADLWPSPEEVAEAIRPSLTSSMFQRALRVGVRRRRALAGGRRSPTARPSPGTRRSTYVLRPPFFEGLTKDPGPGRPTSPAPGCWPCSATA